MSKNAIVFGMLLLVSIAHASDITAEKVKITRYTSVTTGVSKSQQDLLSNMVSFKMERNISSVGEAIERVLQGSGFRLAPLVNSDPYIKVLYTSPLPDIHRDLGPAKLLNVLEVLAGPAWQLITDPVNRLISYDLKPTYWPCNYQSGSRAICD